MRTNGQAITFGATSSMNTEKPESPHDELARLRLQLEKLTTLGNISTISAGLLHDAKQPLALIKTFCGLSLEMIEGLAREFESQMERGEPAAQSDRLLELLENIQFNLGKISENAIRAEHTVNGVPLPANRQNPVAAATDLHTLLDEYSSLACHATQTQNHSFDLKIRKEYDEKIDLVEVVHHDLAQVFLNVFSNSCRALAQKATQDGDDFTPILGIRTRQLATFIEIAIQDNGAGIPEKDLPKIFDSCFTTQQQTYGTGFGLAVCRQILEALGGTISANSRLGIATELLIRLPRADGDVER